MLAEGKGEVVGELRGLGLGDAGLVAADRGEAGAGVEVEGGEGMRERMLADVHACEPELLRVRSRLDGEVDAGGDIGEAVTEFVQQCGVMVKVSETSRLRLWMLSTSLGKKGFATSEVMFLRLKRA